MRKYKILWVWFMEEMGKGPKVPFLSNCTHSIAIFEDLRQAFDLVNHTLLWRKQCK